MLGIDGEYPAAHRKAKFWRFLVKNCKKKSAVKHSTEKHILLNFVNLSPTFCPILYNNPGITWKMAANNPSHPDPGRREKISLTPHYHFQPLHRHLDISRAVTAEGSPLHIASSQTRTGDLWFPSECKSLNTKLPITKNGVLPITTLFFLKILFQFKNLS